MKSDGGPAFPRSRCINEHGFWIEAHPGMSLRSFYKAAALQGWAAGRNNGHDFFADSQPDFIAKSAGRYADAMLAEDEENAKAQPLHPAMDARASP